MVGCSLSYQQEPEPGRQSFFSARNLAFMASSLLLRSWFDAPPLAPPTLPAPMLPPMLTLPKAEFDGCNTCVCRPASRLLLACPAGPIVLLMSLGWADSTLDWDLNSFHFLDKLLFIALKELLKFCFWPEEPTAAD
jgi:hypothetical protein